MTLDRRTFLGRGLALAGGALASSVALDTLSAHKGWAAAGGPPGGGIPYGPLRRARSRNTGEELLALPRGFTYVAFGVTGSTMTDGNPTPIAHDGMAAFPGFRQTPVGPISVGPAAVRLIRNHEVRTEPGTTEGRVVVPASQRYDELGVGGTVTLDVNPFNGEVLQDFASLGGTIVNCAGGIMLNNAGWLTCEETTAGPNDGWAQKHGYVFVVPLVGPQPGQPAAAEPNPAMGRFSHEAVAVDPETGFVYETEDDSGQPNGLFRYRPRNPADLAAGGVLEMLKVKGRPRYDTREGQRMGEPLPVEWVRIDDPDPDLEGGATPVTEQGLAQGGAIFNRLEGCWYGDGSIFFNSTSGGDAKTGEEPGDDGYVDGYGQVWRYIPGDDTLVLVYESDSANALDSPDNITFTPRGGIVLCEDDASDDGDTHPLAPGFTNVNRLIGLDPGGAPFEFAVNISDGSEFAGACFSPDGRIMFVNTFGIVGETPGRTYAILGPWRRGPL